MACTAGRGRSRLEHELEQANARRPAPSRGECVCGKALGKSQGAAKKKKSVTPVVGGWVRVRKRTRVRFIFSIFFYRVFKLPSSRNAQKRDKKKFEKKSVLDFWSNFL